ncbi:kinesin [Ephemerocybe angulata]|uniref:Kinesin n=1 Tax=Ephemerocybe angulata TaxID=980116 RepID=A0A8H6MGQ0_9AGAR|nr:kinesin [Tulosesus angulatus]
MAPSSSSSAAATSVQVALRIRPPTTQDSTSIPGRFQRSVIQASSSTSVAIEPISGALANAGAPSVSSGGASKKQVFTFDQVHGPPTSQYEMFESTTKPLLSRFLEGFNCTILAYGQTSSGKTFTMTGIDLDADPSDPSNGMGVIPRAVSHIFSRANQIKEEKHGQWSYSMKASFIELYNEDLIDLLSLEDATGARREVQIREDKDGHIIWGGLREVNVRNASEVMSLIRKGTSIRRTNETDMNCPILPKRYTGSGPPPRSSSPLPPGGRSPSRLARPGSMYAGPTAARVSSPTQGRPSTPSFASAMHRGSLRPSSALGHSGDRSMTDDEPGDWVTVTSKFHFVDLAGSERLKRTAAQGERIKEGISINSGLLALGNVISALGDPAKAKSNTATYVPYRDSKLTRLLQDSLGGNAHTLMIACISPAEWNAGETLNTLKYANRARNIKNRAVVNEKEDGWDDIEWLQGTVARLRKELKVLKDGGALPDAAKDVDVVDVPSAGPKVLAQLTQLQNNYEDLREKFVERTEELTRLRGELGERHRQSSGGTVGGTAKYEEIVGPVIEEYEKTISAMEAELSLNRAALRMTNELVEEKEQELSEITDRHAATELYVEELRNRVAKLTEREASTEAYIRDLEEKMKAYDETTMTSSESMTDLKKEVARYKEAEAHSGKYIADLEARLAKSDESVLALRQGVENLEVECERRQQEVESLQSRLDTFKKDGESWVTDLEDRERKLKVLEEKMSDWEKKKNEANEARARLGEVVEEVASARRSLEIDLSKLPAHPIVTAPSPISESPPTSEMFAPSQAPDIPGSALEAQLLALQQTHTATLADLSSVTSKYRDALREISDLAAQIQEAKLSNSAPLDSVIPESPAPETPTFRRRMASTRSRESSESSSHAASGGRRLFFRQAASTESLHARSLSQSQSLSQELSSVHSRKTSLSSHGTSSSHSPSNSHSFNGLTHRPNLSISLPSLSPTINGNERSVSSLEKEIIRLQEVLRERETEITALEASLKESQRASLEAEAAASSVKGPALNGVNGFTRIDNGDAALLNAALSPRTIDQFDHIRKTMEGNGHATHSEAPSSVMSDDESLERLNELMLSMAQKESQHRETVDDLNTQLAQTRRQLDDLTTLSRDQAHNMSQELEGLRGKHQEDILALEAVQQREAELVQALEEVKNAHAQEIEEIRLAHEEKLKAKGLELEAAVASIKAENDALVSRLKEEREENVAATKADGEASVASIKAETEAAIDKAKAESEALVALLRVEGEEALAAANAKSENTIRQLREDLESSTIALEKALKNHEIAFGALKADHEKALNRQIEEANFLLDQTRQEHEKAVAKIQADHAIQQRQKDEEAAAAQQTTEEEYYNALTKLRIDHAESIKTINAETAATIERLREEHAHELKTAETAREGSLTASESSRNIAIQDLQEQHVAAIARKEASFSEQIDALKGSHTRELSARNAEHGTQLDRLRLEHETAVTKLNVEWRTEVERLTEELGTEKEQHLSALTMLKKVHEDATQQIREQQANVLQEFERGHEEDVANLKHSHSNTLKEAIATAEAELASIRHAHTEIADLASRLALSEEAAVSNLKEISQLGSKLALSDEAAADLTKQVKELDAKLSASEEISSSYANDIAELHSKLASSEQAVADHVHRVAELSARLAASSGTEAVAKHLSDIDDLTSRLTQAEEHHRRELAEAHLEVSSALEEKARIDSELEVAQRNLLAQDLDSRKAQGEELALAKAAHERELGTKDDMILTMREQLSNVSNERDDLEAEVSKLRAELAQTRGEQSRLIQEASKRDSLVGELERHRSVLAEMQESLQKVKDEKDALQTEKNRSDTTVRELQAQIARSASPPNARSPDRIGFPRGTLPAIKLPPPTPPPTVPPPPAPRSHVNGDSNLSTSSQASSAFMSSNSSYRDSQPESPSTSVGHMPPVNLNSFSPVDPKTAAKIEEQAKHIDEQDAMIKTLNKQLTHCETDLQTHMDLVNKLESSLGDAEKNLRKARMQATELARERDTLNVKVEQMRNELSDAQREVVSVRRSVVEEKQSLEQRLDEERKAKERARQQLDSRMDELQRRKSKFACL